MGTERIETIETASDTPSYFAYWGKAKPATDQAAPYHLLAFHCLDVTAVAKAWWENSTAINNAFSFQTGLEESQAKAWILFFVALHDYGKYDLRFQRKAPEVFAQVNPELSSMKLPLSEKDIKNYWHGPQGMAWFYQDQQERFGSDNWMDDTGEDWEIWSVWIAAVAGHHGKIPQSHEHEVHLPLECHDCEPILKKSRLSWLETLETLLLHPAGLSLEDNPPRIGMNRATLLAGFCSVCDWLGSSETVFPYDEKPLDSTESLGQWYKGRFGYAERALKSAGVLSKVNSDANIQSLLEPDHKPRQVQCLLDELPVQPSLTLFEASTGSGKTEAALAYAWKLLEAGLADSIVFALPTQATTNAMLKRLKNAAGEIFDEQTNLILAHGRARYQQDFIDLKQAGIPRTHQGKDEAWVQCGEWLSQSRKRIFLGQIGVCTVDQVLVSVLPVRHNFVRGFGIGRSVLIIDEVHAYDSYMYGLLTGVLEQQKSAGGSVILLSATLPAYQKNELIKAWGGNLDSESESPYPLISWCHAENAQCFDLKDKPEQQPPINEVWLDLIEHKELLPSEVLLERMEQAVLDGAQVCLVCNLVDVAQNTFSNLSARFSENSALSEDQISLFHSRFTFVDRQAKEQNVLNLFGTDPKPTNVRERGHLLIATQVVEQSLDVDFDWLITQLCPVDLLFQRMGRLHRHQRNRPSGFEKPLCTVLVPDSLDYKLHELIYGNSRVLWRTHQLLREAMTTGGVLRFPSIYREWIELVYQEKDWQNQPESVTESYEEYSQKEQASRYIAKQLMNSTMTPLGDDDGKVTALTRDGDMNLSLVPFYLKPSGERTLLSRQVFNQLSEGEKAEAINMNTVSVPKNWNHYEGQMPESDRNGLIWLQMTSEGHDFTCIYGKWQHFYNSDKGFQRRRIDPEEMQ